MSDQPCSKCGRAVAPGEPRCAACGALQAGNLAALKHGGFSNQIGRGLGPDARADLDTRRAQILADKGGREGLTQLKVDAIEKAVTLHALLNHVGNKLVSDGLFGDRGRARPAVGVYLQLMDRWVRLAQLVGLERNARPVAESLDAYLDGVAECDQADAGGERSDSETAE